MTSSAISLDRIYRYYRDFVVGKQNISFRKGDITIAEWIGTFEPEQINIIPLFEDFKNMLGADSITRESPGQECRISTGIPGSIRPGDELRTDLRNPHE